METLSEFAARWAAAEYTTNRAIAVGTVLSQTIETVFAFAKADSTTPIAQELAAGGDESILFECFREAWRSHFLCLQKLDGKVPLEHDVFKYAGDWRWVNEPDLMPIPKVMAREFQALNAGITSL